MARNQQHKRQSLYPMGPKKKLRTKKSQVEQRANIASFYKEKFYGKTDKDLKGRGGVIATICKELNGHPAIVSRVVKECKYLLDHHSEYDPAEKKFYRPDLMKIQSGSFVQDLTAKYKGRFSFKTSGAMINAMRKIEMGLEYKLEKHYVGITSI